MLGLGSSFVAQCSPACLFSNSMLDFLHQHPNTETGLKRRQVRSFVLREGRLTTGQQHALERLWPKYGLERADGELDAVKTFGREAPLVLEIGYGMGASLADMAANEPDKDFVGIEVHRPGVGALLMAIEQRGLANLRSYCDDAVEVLNKCIADASLDRLQLFFPDPWHKKRHHKRRMVQAAWLSLVARKLKPGGRLHLATDWEDYALQMAELCAAEPSLTNLGAADGFHPRPNWRPLTKFEQRGERLGHGVWDLLWERDR